MNFLNTLSGWQWAIFAAVPPLIVLLYFLKLRRQPLEVPSTYLWSRTIEDLHVNSIWQRLRQSLLLLLQLLLVALAMFACLRPGWRGVESVGERLIFLIDTSASMSATDAAPTRLAQAKKQAIQLIDQMKSGDKAMVISFSDSARVEQSFIDDRNMLKQRVAKISATNRTSNLAEALRAASGLANPGRSGDDENNIEVVVADPLPATLYIFSDGGFPIVPNFSLGNLEPKFVPIGNDDATNVSVAAFHAEPNPEDPARAQAFANLENHSENEIVVPASLYVEDVILDASDVTIPPGGTAGVEFNFQTLDFATLRLELDVEDDLTVDNTAYAVLNSHQLASVLLVTPGNRPLSMALATEQVRKKAEVTTVDTEHLDSDMFRKQAINGTFDLIIFDQCQPKTMPQCNTLFIGRVPDSPGWKHTECESSPIIIDSDRAHPIMKLVQLGTIKIAESLAVTPPVGGASLIDSDQGTILAVGPRDGFEDVVVGFDIVSTSDGAAEINTNWMIRRSFPVFFLNVIEYLGGASSSASTPSTKPGTAVTIRSATARQRVTVTSPTGEATAVQPDAQHAFIYVDTDDVGVYDVREDGGKQVSQRFAVNLFDVLESRIQPQRVIDLGYEQIAGTAAVQPARIELWRWILLAVLGILIFEWYIYNRRVYL